MDQSDLLFHSVRGIHIRHTVRYPITNLIGYRASFVMGSIEIHVIRCNPFQAGPQMQPPKNDKYSIKLTNKCINVHLNS